MEFTDKLITAAKWLSLIGVLFIGLKLFGAITWPWIWVLSPFWIGVAVAGILIITVVVFWQRRGR